MQSSNVSYTDEQLAAARRRFASKVRFDPQTGCVIWTAGTTGGWDGAVRYGSFKFGGKRWSAHRWAAAFIHSPDEWTERMEVRHTCGNTLCVQHVTAELPLVNTAQYWALVHKGYGDPGPPPQPSEPSGWHKEPDWLQALKGEGT